MKILLFRKVLTVEGGAERFMLETAISLKKRGVEVEALTLNGKPGGLFGGKYNGVGLNVWSTEPYPSNFLAKIIRSIRGIWYLRAKIRSWKPDLIIAQNQADAEVAYAATMGTSFKYSVFIPGSMFRFPDDSLKYTRRFRPSFYETWEIIPGHKVFIPEYPPRRNFLRRILDEIRGELQWRAVRKAEDMFTLTHQMGKELHFLYRRDYHITKGALDAAIFDYHKKLDIKEKLGISGRPMVLNINRLDVRKRIDLAIRAFAEFLKDEPQAVFVIGGRGAARESLENLVKELNLEGKVQFIGFVPEEELYDHYLACDVFIHPDWVDYDLGILEPLALGKKVVCSSEVELEAGLEKLENIRLFRAFPELEPTVKALREAYKEDKNPPAPLKEILKDYTWDGYAENLLKYLGESK